MEISKSRGEDKTRFSVSIQEHKVLGAIFAAHILRPLEGSDAIFTVVDNVFPENFNKWKAYIPEEGEALVKIINEISDSQLLKVIGKGKTTLSQFYESVKNDEVFGGYVRSYLDRRMLKCYDILASCSIPVYVKEKNFSTIYHEHHVQLFSGFAEPIFKFVVTPNETQYSLSVSHKGQRLGLRVSNVQLICNQPCIVRIGMKLLRFESMDSKKLLPFLTKEFLSIPKSAEKKYFETFVLNAIKTQIVECEGFKIVEESISVSPVLVLEHKLNGRLGLVLYFRYGKKDYLSHTIPQKEVKLVEIKGFYEFRCFTRDIEVEKRHKKELVSLGLESLQGAEYVPTVVMTSSSDLSDNQLVSWLNMNQKFLIKNGFVIEQRVDKIRYYLGAFSLDLKAKMERDWFDVYGLVVLNTYQFPFLLLKKNILKGICEYVLPNGDIFIIPEEWFSKYKPIFLIGREEEEGIKLSRSCFSYLIQNDIPCQEAKEIYNNFEQAMGLATIPEVKGLNAVLRGYQKVGLRWLQILNETGIGGCLADDMGLGKTLQTLALLQHLKETEKERATFHSQEKFVDLNETSIIVVPTSLLFNWQNEIKRFTPNLSVYQFTGPNRTRSIKALSGFDVILTTYGVLRNDIEMLMNVRFHYAILDEGQTIKNPATKAYRSALLLKANHFLVLSGTPIENSLIDLWALVNLLNRGMLGSLRSFRNEYLKPIEEQSDEHAKSNLLKLVKPIILRRTKEEVAPELPDLNEQVVYCNLNEEQKRIYEVEKSMVRNEIIESIEKQGYGKSSISILRGLTRLRQLANHPGLIDEYKGYPSGKFEEIVRNIETLVVEGHKMLVFSSFVKHLEIVEEYLLENGIGYQKLIGSTINRERVVEEFQNDSNTKVFLISIKAGGVGLNLTAADYILILDPWWNPATENQALARAHRIGQTNKVFVYRFISVETVEEKIRKLQESKQLLADQFVGSSYPLDVLSREMMMEVLA